MKLNELKTVLENKRVPKQYYSLNGGLPPDSLCIEQAKNGKWFTYYSDRGSRSELIEFETEEEACDYFYTWISNDSYLENHFK